MPTKFKIILLSFYLVTPMIQAQNEEILVSLEYKNKPLDHILKNISADYGIDFSYSNDFLHLNESVSIIVSEKPLDKALNVLFNDKGIHFQVFGDQIALKRTTPKISQIRKVKRKKIMEKDERISNVEKLALHPSNIPFSDAPNLKFSFNPAFYKDLEIAKKAHRSRFLQLGIVPGFGSNGIDCGAFNNDVSFNLFSGYSASTTYLEIAGLSNFNTDRSSGLQIAGLVNIIGGNGLLKLSPDELKYVNSNGYNFNMDGIQFSGLLNVVRGNVTGWQLSGGQNLAYNSASGVQMGGIANVVWEYSTGLQVAGLFNLTGKSVSGFQISSGVNFSVDRMAGVQIAGVMNFTKGRLSGTQISLLNFSGNIEGKYSLSSTNYSGLQIGMANITKRNMDGFQIGIINLASNVNGLQFGIINVSKGKQRVPIGLVNINSKENGYFRIYGTESFMYNASLGTGAGTLTNTISYSRNPKGLVNKGRPITAFGYAIGKLVYKQGRFYNADIQFQHLNYTKGIQKELSLLTKARISAGYDPFHGTKYSGIYIFGGISFNTYFSRNPSAISDDRLQLIHKQSGDKFIESWVGFMFGINVRL